MMSGLNVIAGAVTTIVNVCVCVILSASVAVYVNVAELNLPVGVPAKTRVPVVNVAPAGSVGVKL